MAAAFSPSTTTTAAACDTHHHYLFCRMMINTGRDDCMHSTNAIVCVKGLINCSLFWSKSTRVIRNIIPSVSPLSIWAA
jgi:hypothetical protein